MAMRLRGDKLCSHAEVFEVRSEPLSTGKGREAEARQTPKVDRATVTINPTALTEENRIMSRNITLTVFQYEELSDKAKETARDWYRDATARAGDNFFAEHVIEDAVRMGTLMGITFKTRTIKLMSGKTREEPQIEWSGFSSQGDGACFEGTYTYQPGIAAAIATEAPGNDSGENIILRRIAAELESYGVLSATLTKRNHHYSHPYTVEIEVYDSEGIDITNGTRGKAVAQALRDFMNWIYRNLEAEYDYQNADIRSSPMSFTRMANGLPGGLSMTPAQSSRRPKRLQTKRRHATSLRSRMANGTRPAGVIRKGINEHHGQVQML
jgi:hypothetical protein